MATVPKAPTLDQRQRWIDAMMPCLPDPELRTHALNWDALTLVPPEAEALNEVDPIDPFADDDRLGLLSEELSRETAAPAEPRLDLAEWFEVQAAAYRSHGTPLARYVAFLLEGQADDARRHKANTLEDLAERSRIEEEEYEERLEAEARAKGYDAAIASIQPAGYDFGHHSDGEVALVEARAVNALECVRLLKKYRD